MPNIYLRLPSYLAQFYRNLDTRRPLRPGDPVKFSPYTAAGFILSSWPVPFRGKPDTVACFSERMWRNMMEGKPPTGGRPVIHRDPAQWLSPGEICLLNTIVSNTRNSSVDYLCISVPSTIILNNQYKPVTDQWALRRSEAVELANHLRRFFIYRLMLWIRAETSHCLVSGMPIRDTGMCVDHFFAHYNISYGDDEVSHDSMRRMAARWAEEANVLAAELEGDEDAIYDYEPEETEVIGDEFSESEYLTDVLNKVKKREK